MGKIVVGRQREKTKLASILEKSLAKQASICFILGSAGTGKSTLAHEFINQAGENYENLVALVGNCNALTGKSDPYLPFVEIMTQLSGSVEAKLSQGAISSQNANRIKKLAMLSGKTLLEYAPDLVGIFVPGASLAAKIIGSAVENSGVLDNFSLEENAHTLEIDQGRIWKQYTDMLVAFSEKTPLLVVIDDLQWADTASLELLFHLAHSLEQSRIMILGIYRPDDITGEREGKRHPLVPVINEIKRRFGDVFVNLDEQSENEKQIFVFELLDREPNRLDKQFRLAFFERTKGYPLFTIELLQELKDREYLVKDSEGYWNATADLEWNILPSRVEGIIEERIGRLEKDVYEILSLASVEGENFTAQVVSNLKQVSELDLVKLLSRQLDKQHHLVHEISAERIGRKLLSRYIFSHVLFQQYLYNELSLSERMILHSEVANVLENLYENQQDKIALQLAHHYSMAGEAEKAIFYLLEAAKRTISLSAYAEADGLLKKALKLSASLPDDPERARQILNIYSLQSTVIVALNGWDSPDLDVLYRQMRSLCERLNEQAPLSKILFGQWAYSLIQLHLDDALQTAMEYEKLAENFIEARVPAFVATGNTLFWMGDIHGALKYMENALQAFQPELQSSYLLQFGQDPRVIAYQYILPTLWMKGDFKQAQIKLNELWCLVESLQHPFSTASALYTVTCQMYLSRAISSVEDYSQQLISLCSEKSFPFYLGLGKVFHGWAQSLSGNTEAGIHEMKDGFENWVAVYGGKIIHSLYCLMLAEAHSIAGNYDEGISMISTGITVGAENREVCYEAELYRLRGELLLMASPDGVQAEADIEKSLMIARQRGQLAFQLRTALGLARHKGLQNNVKSTLESVLAEFTSDVSSDELDEAYLLLQAGSII